MIGLASPLLVAGPIRAWRWWSVNDFGQLDGTFYRGDPWDPKTPYRAICRKGEGPVWSLASHPGKAPGSECTCGVYGLKRALPLCEGRTSPEHPTIRIPASTDSLWVWGAVALWGSVIEHAEGYRAEYGYPLSFTRAIAAYQPEAVRRWKLVEDLYGIAMPAEVPA